MQDKTQEFEEFSKEVFKNWKGDSFVGRKIEDEISFHKKWKELSAFGFDEFAKISHQEFMEVQRNLFLQSSDDDSLGNFSIVDESTIFPLHIYVPQNFKKPILEANRNIVDKFKIKDIDNNSYVYDVMELREHLYNIYNKITSSKEETALDKLVENYENKSLKSEENQAEKRNLHKQRS